MDERNANFIIRNIPPSPWRSVKATAAEHGETIREAMLRVLREYIKTRARAVKR